MFIDSFREAPFDVFCHGSTRNEFLDLFLTDLEHLVVLLLIVSCGRLVSVAALAAFNSEEGRCGRHPPLLFFLIYWIVFF